MRIIAIFQRAKDFQVPRLASRYPPPAPRRCSKFDNAVERVLEKVVLLNFVGEQIGPHRRHRWALRSFKSMQFPSHTAGVGGVIGPGWETEEVRNNSGSGTTKSRSDRKRPIRRLAKDQEERMNAEERERFLAARKNGT